MYFPYFSRILEPHIVKWPYFLELLCGIQSEKVGKHNEPHIHALYGDDEIVVGIDGEVLEGNFPNKKLKLLLAWIAMIVFWRDSLHG